MSSRSQQVHRSVDRMSKSGMSVVALAALLTITSLFGCRRSVEKPTQPQLTSTAERSQRRAFKGAPPVIPHKALGAACTTCHTDTGKPVPDMAYAPANPHGNLGGVQNCRQCHLFKRGEDQFAQSDFQPLATDLEKGDRLFAGAPPTIPHPLLMRQNCLACHAGPSARPEVRCDHPERSNCVQCHVAQPTDGPPDSFASAAQ